MSAGDGGGGEGEQAPRVALVTGGAGGIGRAIVTTLHARGLLVAVADLDEGAAERFASELREAGQAALAVAMDVTDSAGVRTAVSAVGEQLGAVDVLINNAGWDELHPFVETDEDFWRRVVDVNYLGALRVTHAVLPGMIDQGFGRIVSISSDAARVGSSLESVYAGAKAALIGFTKSLAREVARSGVTANVVCPGPTQTPMLAGIIERDERGARIIDAMTGAVPMRRLGAPEDIAAAVAYFVSDDAAYVTGQTLSVSGGLTMA
ncbi:MAG TPA: SDR family NAD(P)-dependent oxidoreductase [Solirubrobacteraceae bacterium]|nr:SDR family NAD(P)-dependent oxidoreductase [Solirubrobacteraceae bacterium]